MSQPTADALDDGVELDPLAPTQVKGRDATVHAYRMVTSDQ